MSLRIIFGRKVSSAFIASATELQTHTCDPCPSRIVHIISRASISSSTTRIEIPVNVFSSINTDVPAKKSVECIFCRDGAPMELDQMLHDSQAQPESAVRSSGSSISLSEAVEDMRQK